MSADELRRRAVEAISEERDAAMTAVVNTRYRSAGPCEGGVMPGSTSEEIAFQVIEANAQVRAFTRAIEVMNEIYRRMHQPDDEKAAEKKRVELY